MLSDLGNAQTEKAELAVDIKRLWRKSYSKKLNASELIMVG